LHCPLLYFKNTGTAKNMNKLQRYLPVGALGISLVLHLAIFLGISGVILIQAVAPKLIPVGDLSQSHAEDLPEPPEVPDETLQPVFPGSATDDNTEQKQSRKISIPSRSPPNWLPCPS
jgi:hypothetical protein